MNITDDGRPGRRDPIIGGPTMLQSLIVYAAWAALVAAIIASIVIVQGAIRQLLQDSAEGAAEELKTHPDVPAPRVD